ncbi:sulfoquinovosidase [Patella vulgata]|uniref:sulfoquinovosidase n=1 Tax=Patella vulgata TaxID=6465 RepID=UPI0024A8BDBD|nr:sulfoquinovosidase [Patella vulgata]
MFNQADNNEAIYGGGEQYSYLNLRGRQYPIWTGEQGIGRNRSTLVTYVTDLKQSGGDYYTTYFPQPTFYSTNKYYFHHGGSNYAILDFSHPDFHEIFIADQPGRLYFNSAETFPLLVSSLTNFLGRMPNLPDWIHDGAIIGVQGGSKQMMDYINYSQAHGLNIAGVWIQDWAGSVDDLFGHRLFWNWEWNQQLYPVDSSLFKYAEQFGYFVKNSSNETYIQDFAGIMAGSIDLTNPDAYHWYKNQIIKENMIEFGMSGWMADFSEYLPIDAKLYNNQSAKSYHNIWPVLWAKLNREAVEELGMLGKVVFFLRAGFSGTGKYSTLMWAGDQDVDFTYADGIASTIPAALNMGLSGVGITHFDIGGYTTFAPLLVRREELLLRSAEYAAFGPVFRTHQGNQPKENVQFYSTPEISDKFARLTHIFKTLKNYTKIVLNDTVTSGVPAYKPLFFNYPDDVRCYNVTYQFLYGNDLLIAPVILDFRKHWDYLQRCD